MSFILSWNSSKSNIIGLKGGIPFVDPAVAVPELPEGYVPVSVVAPESVEAAPESVAVVAPESAEVEAPLATAGSAAADPEESVEVEDPEEVEASVDAVPSETAPSEEADAPVEADVEGPNEPESPLEAELAASPLLADAAAALPSLAGTRFNPALTIRLHNGNNSMFSGCPIAAETGYRILAAFMTSCSV